MTLIRTVDGRPAVLRETTGERLQRLRLAKGLSQFRLMGLSGIDSRTIWRLEHDEPGRPSVTTIESLADALGVTMQYLWSGEAGCRHEDELVS